MLLFLCLRRQTIALSSPGFQSGAKPCLTFAAHHLFSCPVAEFVSTAFLPKRWLDALQLQTLLKFVRLPLRLLLVVISSDY